MSAFATIQGYQVRQLRLDEDISAVVPAWKRCNARINNDTIHSDPEWLLETTAKGNVQVFVFDSDGETVGAVPFLKVAKPLKCQLGELTLARIPLRVLQLLGTYPNIPEEETACDALFSQVKGLEREFDALYIEYVRVGSFLWKYLHKAALVKRNFRLYSPRGIVPHPLIRINGSFDDYLKKFSSKTRSTQFRKLRKLREHGEVEVIRITEAHEAEAFVDAAAEISQRTYQYRLLGGGVRDRQVWKRLLTFAANHGWLRSYLLKCDGIPCSFLVAYQYGETFYHSSLGYDPAWSNLSVGTVLQMLILEDVFSQNRPALYDYGTYGGYKMFFSNDNYLESDFYLFPRRAYPLLAQVSHCTFSTISRRAGAVLNRLSLKEGIKRLVRRSAAHG
jgi:hypothetical protein